MKCIITKRTYGKGTQLLREEIIGESRDRTEVIQILNKLKMTVDASGNYRITNGTGGTIRQGLCPDSPESIFAIVDSCDFNIGNMKLQTPSYSGSYEDYEQKFGFGRVLRDVKTKWRAYSETLPNDAGYTAIGLVKYDSQVYYEIHSLYIPERYGRRRKSDYILDFIEKRLKANEYASIQSVGMAAKRTDVHFIRNELYKHRYELPRLLYNDAAERMGSVSEVIPEGMTYIPEKLFTELDGAEAENEVRAAAN